VRPLVGRHGALINEPSNLERDMTANTSLSASTRENHGKNAARALRRTGRVPGIVYGHGDANRSISLDQLELEKLLGTISVENTLIDLQLDGQPVRTLIREVQWHPYKPTVLHVDFLEIHAGEKLKLNVPIRIVGTPFGVSAEGGVLDQVLHDLEVECLPRHIPDAAEVDVSELKVGDVLRVRDISMPNDEELAVLSIHAPSVAALEEGAEAEDTVGGEAEPELIRKPRGDDETADQAE
jgi:large subunit ribosomal protein L25